MPTERDLCFTPATELLRLYRARKVSPLEVMQAVLARIDAVNPAVNAYRDAGAGGRAARGAARHRARFGAGAALPPLHGVPVGIKDLTPTKGIRTTWGSKIFEDHVPDEDAAGRPAAEGRPAPSSSARPTRRSSAPAGTPSTRSSARRAIPGTSRSPAGGSSGGAAVALATGMCPLAQGTDLGGSLRDPGGLLRRRRLPHHARARPALSERTSPGTRISVHGPDGADGRRHRRSCCRSMAGPDDRAPLSYDVDTRSLPARRSTRALGQGLARRVDARPRRPDPGGPRGRPRSPQARPRVSASLGARVERGRPATSREVHEIVAGHAGPLDGRRATPTSSARWRGRDAAGPVWNIEQGLALTPASDRARRAPAHAARGTGSARSWRRDDLLILPTVAVPPFPVEQPYPTEINGKPLENYTPVVLPDLRHLGDRAARRSRCPCGFTRDGLPVGLQIVGRRRQEAAVLRAAAAFEAARPWARTCRRSSGAWRTRTRDRPIRRPGGPMGNVSPHQRRLGSTAREARRTTRARCGSATRCCSRAPPPSTGRATCAASAMSPSRSRRSCASPSGAWARRAAGSTTWCAAASTSPTSPWPTRRARARAVLPRRAAGGHAGAGQRAGAARAARRDRARRRRRRRRRGPAHLVRTGHRGRVRVLARGTGRRPRVHLRHHGAQRPGRSKARATCTGRPAATMDTIFAALERGGRPPRGSRLHQDVPDRSRRRAPTTRGPGSRRSATCGPFDVARRSRRSSARRC